MDHYIDIRVLPDPEFTECTLMAALCSKLHRVLVRREETTIGISFPRHALKPNRTLGDVLRLHGNANALQALMVDPWLNGMRGHLKISDISQVPDKAKYRTVRRRQFKTNAERMRRRRAKRHDETMEEARKQIPGRIERKVDLPFLTLRSQSTGHGFALFVEHGPLKDEPTEGAFNSYGLSRSATVPWF